MRLHHVQVACPPGSEDAARRFYAEGLGMTEVNVGVEDPFRPARKAHPALGLEVARQSDFRLFHSHTSIEPLLDEHRYLRIDNSALEATETAERILARLRNA